MKKKRILPREIDGAALFFLLQQLYILAVRALADDFSKHGLRAHTGTPLYDQYRRSVVSSGPAFNRLFDRLTRFLFFFYLSSLRFSAIFKTTL